ncbi:hypothetical protein [Stenotrophomonas pavanii]|uniref:hypothetical protein n=1 Tax=Stenotrophomonas pavanii TaxID=487698 RepID=UPI001EFA1739
MEQIDADGQRRHRLGSTNEDPAVCQSSGGIAALQRNATAEKVRIDGFQRCVIFQQHRVLLHGGVAGDHSAGQPEGGGFAGTQVLGLAAIDGECTAIAHTPLLDRIARDNLRASAIEIAGPGGADGHRQRQ